MDNSGTRKNSQKSNEYAKDRKNYSSYLANFGTTNRNAIKEFNEKKEFFPMRRQRLRQEQQNDKCNLTLPPLKPKCNKLGPSTENSDSTRVPQSWTSKKYSRAKPELFADCELNVSQDRQNVPRQNINMAMGDVGLQRMLPRKEERPPGSAPYISRSKRLCPQYPTEKSPRKEFIRLPKIEEGNLNYSTNNYTQVCKKRRNSEEIKLPSLNAVVNGTNFGVKQTCPFEVPSPCLNRRPDTPASHVFMHSRRNHKNQLFHPGGEMNQIENLSDKKKALRKKSDGRNALSSRTSKDRPKKSLDKKPWSTEINVVINPGKCISESNHWETPYHFNCKSIEFYINNSISSRMPNRQQINSLSVR